MYVGDSVTPRKQAVSSYDRGWTHRISPPTPSHPPTKKREWQEALMGNDLSYFFFLFLHGPDSTLIY